MNLIVGATGVLGTEICRRLVARGKPVKGMVRATAAPAKVERLQGLGVVLVEGDLRDRASLDAACQGVTAVISTATTTISRQPGDSIEATDRDGQLNLVAAARAAGVRHFVFVSAFYNMEDSDDPLPLIVAKRAVEQRLRESGMGYTILRPTNFIEIWLSPMVGFDYPNAKATLYGSGQNRTSWIALGDVAEFAVQSLDHPAARNAVIDLGGPEALSPLEVVTIFEELSGCHFEIGHVPVEALRAQQAAATDSLEKTLAMMGLYLAQGNVIEMHATLEAFPMQLTSVREYAERVLVPAAPLVA